MQTPQETIYEIYIVFGFHAVMKYIKGNLHYGKVKQLTPHLYRITTGGWSDDEDIIKNLIGLTSPIRKHFIGYITGGAYYFSETGDTSQYEIKEKKNKMNYQQCEDKKNDTKTRITKP